MSVSRVSLAATQQRSSNVPGSARLNRAGLFLEPLPAHQEAFQAQAAWKPPSQLKRLQLVGSYGEYCNSRLGELYWESRKHLPALLQSSVAAVESRMALVGSPVMQALQAKSQKLLLQVDTKVSH